MSQIEEQKPGYSARHRLKIGRWVLLASLVLLFARWVWVLRQPTGLSSGYQAHFEWDATKGFKTFRIENEKGEEVGGRLWQSVVAIQLKPRLDSYLRQPGWQRINGYSSIRVWTFAPFAYPTALGSDGEVLYDPDETPLMDAAAKGNTKSVEELLSAGADVNAVDQRGQTALIHACRRGDSDRNLIRALLRAGAKVNASDRWGRTALLFAVQTSRSIPGMPRTDGAAVVEELISAHADVNAKDQKGFTPLMMAVRDAEIGIVQALLRAGADVDARNNEGQTARSLAEESGRVEIVQLLRQH